MEPAEAPSRFTRHERALIALVLLLVVAITTAVQWRMAPYRGGHNFGPWPDCLEYVAGAQSIVDSGEYYLQVGRHQVQPRYNPGTSMLHAVLLAVGLSPHELYRANGIYSGLLGALLAIATLWLAHVLGATTTRAGRRFTILAALAAGLGWGLCPIGLDRTDAGSDLAGALTANTALLLALFACFDGRPRRAWLLMLLAGSFFGSAAAIRTSGGVLLLPCLLTLLLAVVIERGWLAASKRGAALVLGAAPPLLLTAALMHHSGWGALDWSAYVFWSPEFYGPDAQVFSLDYALHGHGEWPVPQHFGSDNAGNLEIALGLFLGLPLTDYLGIGWFWPLLAMSCAVLTIPNRLRAAGGRKWAVGLSVVALGGWFAGHWALFVPYFYPDDRFYIPTLALLFPLLFACLAALRERARGLVDALTVLSGLLMLLACGRAFHKYSAGGIHGVRPAIQQVRDHFDSWHEGSDLVRSLSTIPFDTVVAQACGLLPKQVVDDIGVWGRLDAIGEHAYRLLVKPEFEEPLPDFSTPPAPVATKLRFVPESARAGNSPDAIFDKARSRLVWDAGTPRSSSYAFSLLPLREEGRLEITALNSREVPCPVLDAQLLEAGDGEIWQPVTTHIRAIETSENRVSVLLGCNGSSARIVFECRTVGRALSLRCYSDGLGNGGTSRKLRIRSRVPGMRALTAGPNDGAFGRLASGEFVSILHELTASTATRSVHDDDSSVRSLLWTVPRTAGAEAPGATDALVWVSVADEAEACLPRVPFPPAETGTLASSPILLGDPSEAARSMLAEMELEVTSVPLQGDAKRTRGRILQLPVRSQSADGRQFLATLNALPLVEPEKIALARGERTALSWRTLRFFAAAALPEDILTSDPPRPPTQARGTLLRFRPTQGRLGGLDVEQLRGLLAGALPCVSQQDTKSAPAFLVEFASFVVALADEIHAGTDSKGLPPSRTLDSTLVGCPVGPELEIFANLGREPTNVELSTGRIRLAPGDFVLRSRDGMRLACIHDAEGPRWLACQPSAVLAWSGTWTEAELQSLGAKDASDALRGISSFGRIDYRRGMRWSLEGERVLSSRFANARTPAKLELIGEVPVLRLDRPTLRMRVRALDAERRPAPLPRDLTWSSSTPGSIGVAQEGLVRATSPGSARIRVESPKLGTSAEASVRADLEPQILSATAHRIGEELVIRVSADRPCRSVLLVPMRDGTARGAPILGRQELDERSHVLRVHAEVLARHPRHDIVVVDEFGLTARAPLRAPPAEKSDGR